MNQLNINSRESLAWIVLLGGFFICLVITISTPILITRNLQESTQALTISALANQGTVGIADEEFGTRALFAGNLPQSVSAGASIQTNTTDTALLELASPNTEVSLGRIELFANTTLVVEQADSPRYERSDHPHQFAAHMPAGRVRLNLLPDPDRPIHVLINTPHGVVTIEQAGQYSLEVTNANTQLSVLSGLAKLSVNGEFLELMEDERGLVNAGNSPIGPLDTERNLITNPDFRDGLRGWVLLDWNVELPDQPLGITDIITRTGQPALSFSRVGAGHADAGVRQIIEQDVTGFESLKLSINMQINTQTLSVCGVQGSECPLTVRIEYENIDGIPSEWLHGFYAIGNINEGLPDVCVYCPPPRTPHVSFTPSQLKFYESDNLLDLFRQNGIEVSRIKNISLIGAGHGFDVTVLDVALLAKE